MATTTKRDYYEVLGVPRDADQDTIKRAFRRLALKYHPDRSKEPNAAERFKEVVEAYGALSDPHKRAAYDAQGFPGIAGFTAEDLLSGVDLSGIFGDMGFPHLGEGLFEGLFGARSPSGPPRGADVEADLTVPLARLLTGGPETVHIRRPDRCEACSGTGARAGTRPRVCESCHGTGRQVVTRRQENVVMQEVTTCPTCEGRGSFVDEPCEACAGRGVVELVETLSVDVPAGAEEGAALRIAGHGLPSTAPGGPPGDAYVVVRSARDPRFVRRGADLWRTEVVSVPEAVLGTTRAVPTLEEDVTVTLPAGAQPGTVLRVPGRGLPHSGGPGRGDLHVAVIVAVPERLTRKERRLYEQLRDLR